MRAFLGLGDSAVFHCMLCLIISGLYRKTQVSSPVMICIRIFELSLIFSCMSSQNLAWFCFWSSNKILGTILAHIFHITRSCSKIIHIDSLFRPSSSDIIHTVNLQSLHTRDPSEIFWVSHKLTMKNPKKVENFPSLIVALSRRKPGL